MGRRKDRTAPDRASRYRDAKVKDGWRSVTVLLPPDAAAALDALSTASGETKAGLLANLLRGALDASAAEDVL